jgi:hypothetical protein
MPRREMVREQGWLLPPTLDELLAEDHPARYVGAFVDGLTEGEWAELGLDTLGEALGAPAYHPRALLCAWLYHNTLWRFYQAHRPHLRSLLRQTVQTAVRLELVDWAVQAVDGTKVMGNAGAGRVYGRDETERLLERADKAILDLEAQNESGGDPPPPGLPKELRQAQQLTERVLEAWRSLTDPDDGFMRSHQGYVLGYNAQVMAAPVTGGGGMLITAAEVTQDPGDSRQLLPLVTAARENTGHAPLLTLADAGYFSGANLSACAEAGIPLAMPEKQFHPADPYHKDRFTYDPARDSYTCPQGQILVFGHVRQRKQTPVRVYRPPRSACRLCPAMGRCTKNRVQGRLLEVTPHGRVLKEHRRWMETPEAKTGFRRRKGLVEPVFGILKEQQSARRFLRRGLEGVRSEWSLLAAAFNLRSLWKAKRRSMGGPPLLLAR